MCHENWSLQSNIGVGSKTDTLLQSQAIFLTGVITNYQITLLERILGNFQGLKIMENSVYGEHLPIAVTLLITADVSGSNFWDEHLCIFFSYANVWKWFSKRFKKNSTLRTGVPLTTYSIFSVSCWSGWQNQCLRGRGTRQYGRFVYSFIQHKSLLLFYDSSLEGKRASEKIKPGSSILIGYRLTSNTCTHMYAHIQTCTQVSKTPSYIAAAARLMVINPPNLIN